MRRSFLRSFCILHSRFCILHFSNEKCRTESAKCTGDKLSRASFHSQIILHFAFSVLHLNNEKCKTKNAKCKLEINQSQIESCLVPFLDHFAFCILGFAFCIVISGNHEMQTAKPRMQNAKSKSINHEARGRV